MSFDVCRRIAIAGITGLALLPSAASAATRVHAFDFVVTVDGDARANAITITPDEDRGVYVAEAGATVVDGNPDDSCFQAGDRVRCDYHRRVDVHGAEGNDTLTSDAPNIVVHLHGQAGDDVLNSSVAGYKTALFGGDGNDTLNARTGTIGSNDPGAFESTYPQDSGDAGNDTLNGNPDNADQFVEEPGGDTYNGGTPATYTDPVCRIDPNHCGDSDSIWYREGPVNVTLDGVANDGRAGEADNVQRDVDSVAGSPANDVISAQGATIRHQIAGGAGDDTITGGAGHDALGGGQGADTITGGAGHDRLSSSEREEEGPVPATDRMDGGDGDDIFDTGLGADDLAGGGGIDRVDFRSRSDQVANPTSFDITLDGQPNDGPKGAGEGDNVRVDVEIVSTGPGADRIVGSTDAEQLSGGAGDDVIDGGGGVDVLAGEDGADTLISRDLGFDVVNCGLGTDPAAQADEGDQLHNCEAASLTPLPPPADTIRPKVALSGARSISARAFGRARGVTVTAATDEATVLVGEALAKGMLARTGELVLGQRTLPLSNAGSRKIAIRFSRSYVRAIQRKLRKRAYRLTVRVTATDAEGNSSTATRRITISRR